MRELKPGTKIRVEHNAEVIGLADPSNPFWYTIRYPSGEIDTVSLARINNVVDTPRMVIDHDASMQLFTPRLSAQGCIELMLWLETHRAEFESVVTQVSEESTPPDEA